MAEWFEVLIKVTLVRAFVALSERFGFWGALALSLGFVAALWLIGWTVAHLARAVRLLVHGMIKIVPPGQAVPPFFGVSYIDLATNSRVCHVIPINLLVAG